MLLHPLHRLLQVLLRQNLAADDIPEQPADCAQARPDEPVCLFGLRGGILLGIGICQNGMDFVAQVLEHELALRPRSPRRGVHLLDRTWPPSRICVAVARHVGRRVVELDVLALVDESVGVPLSPALDRLCRLRLPARALVAR